MNEKVTFDLGEEGKVEFYVIEQTRLGGVDYLLVAEEENDETECYIMKDVSGNEDAEAIYEMVEDEKELNAVADVFAEMLEDMTIEK